MYREPRGGDEGPFQMTGISVLITSVENQEHGIENHDKGSKVLTLTRRVNVFPHLEQTKAAGTKLGS